MCEDIQARVSELVAELREKVREKDNQAGAPRGAALQQAIDIINGERQDVYGSPEDSFSKIADYWRTYLRHKKNLEITSSDVAMMMTLFKIARIANGSAHRDSYVDAAGYIGLAADMCCEVKDV